MLPCIASRARLLLLVALPAFAAGCGGVDESGLDSGPLTVPDAGVPDTGAVDPTAVLFDPGHIVQVRIDLAPADWDQLRQQTRNLFDILTGDCVAAPFPSPFTYFSGTVIVDGQTLPSVGVKKKGFIGSLSTDKPSLKLSFDHTIKGQRVSGMDAMTLNNAKQDPSFVRQCLGYAAFARAGIPSPRCNFAHVVVNDTDLGLYVHVEGVDKDFLRRHYADVSGNLYEGTLSDFDSTLLATFDLKTNETANDRSDLAAVASALTAPDADLLARLEPLVNLDEFFDDWAMDSVLRQWDGYANNTNNFFVYHDPVSGQFSFLPWGIDGIMDPSTGGTSGVAAQPVAVMTKAALTRRLYAMPATRERYFGRIRALLDAAFQQSDILPEIDRMQRLILPFVAPADAAGVRAGIDQVRTFVTTRRQVVLAELAAPPAGAPAAAGVPCLKPIGTIAGSFSTTWDTLAAANPFAAGSATLAATVNGAPLPVDLLGATSGLDTTGTDGPRTAVNVIVHLTDGTYAAVILRVYPWVYAPNATLPFDLGATVGALAKFEGSTVTMTGLLGNGSIHLVDAGATPGAAVTGSFAADLYAWPF